MVDVKWDFQGAALDMHAAEKAVGKVVTFYQQALASTICPIHNQEPWLKVEGRTPQSLAVSIEACCGELLERAKISVGGVSRRGQE